MRQLRALTICVLLLAAATGELVAEGLDSKDVARIVQGLSGNAI
jgi:hypothetical protein